MLFHQSSPRDYRLLSISPTDRAGTADNVGRVLIQEKVNGELKRVIIQPLLKISGSSGDTGIFAIGMNITGSHAVKGPKQLKNILIKEMRKNLAVVIACA